MYDQHINNLKVDLIRQTTEIKLKN